LGGIIARREPIWFLSERNMTGIETKVINWSVVGCVDLSEYEFWEKMDG
jgi:hypothetical protein